MDFCPVTNTVKYSKRVKLGNSKQMIINSDNIRKIISFNGAWYSRKLKKW